MPMHQISREHNIPTVFIHICSKTPMPTPQSSVCMSWCTLKSLISTNKTSCDHKKTSFITSSHYKAPVQGDIPEPRGQGAAAGWSGEDPCLFVLWSAVMDRWGQRKKKSRPGLLAAKRIILLNWKLLGMEKTANMFNDKNTILNLDKMWESVSG